MRKPDWYERDNESYLRSIRDLQSAKDKQMMAENGSTSWGSVEICRLKTELAEAVYDFWGEVMEGHRSRNYK